HILARAVVAAGRQRDLSLLPVAGFHEVAGNGVTGAVAVDTAVDRAVTQVDVAIGNRTFMRLLEISLPQPLLDERARRAGKGQIASFLALAGRVVALLVFADVPRPEVAELGLSLRDAGLREVVLLTGDGEAAARRVGQLAQVDRVIAHCLPEDK